MSCSCVVAEVIVTETDGSRSTESLFLHAACEESIVAAPTVEKNYRMIRVRGVVHSYLVLSNCVCSLACSYPSKLMKDE